MRKPIYVALLSFVVLSCKTKEVEIMEITFENRYKFTNEIEKSVLGENPDYQDSSVDYSYVVNHEKALEHWDLATNAQPKKYKQEQLDSVRNLYKVNDAKDYILSQANNEKIIMINEMHYNATHRIFTEELLKDLYAKGYKNLCVEALYNDGSDTLLNALRYSKYEFGTYLWNPQFSNMIRKALKIGFKIHAYETKGDIGGEVREIDQANNMAKIIKENPDEKFLIHCGSGHALEGNIKFFGGAALAGRLHQLTGIDPFTIDQVFYSEKSKRENSNIFSQAFNFENYSILLDKNSKPFGYKKGEERMDLVVFHPMTTYNNKRPNWVFERGNKDVEINMNKINLEFPVMVLAFNSNEELHEAIPIDITEVEKRDAGCHLGLPKGNYNIVVTNKSESILFKKDVL
ncbi:hypothetical protein NO995_16135 [Aestuariibaculum sp. M13]|uniref:hypothetical protein n=1 Tax=Aestuariibaculum sp. M13 TaxID=2967132 RepID=UPI002159E5EC|nr:hypothetical protein [Aestuariibaculum sp. M13]MCR8669217.1 hypothetical protein [Aestuariibaculum sp. M13]